MFKRLFIVFMLCCTLFTVFTAGTDAISVPSESAILIDERGCVIYEKNAHDRRRQASTTKIMTALVALDSDITETVTITADSVGVEGSSIYLSEGEKLTLEELLYALLLQSANDAATAIAVHIGGSVEGFANLMNSKAAELSLKDTHFTNPHGLDDDSHYTTAYDLAMLSLAALKNPRFAGIVSTYKKVITGRGGEGMRILVNHNKLLLTYDGADGVKTGFTKKSGRCLVSSATRDNLSLIAVTLDCPDDWRTHKSMLDFGFGEYEALLLCEKGKSFSFPVVGAEKDSFTCSVRDTVKLILPRKEREIRIEKEFCRFYYAPVEADAPVGMLRFYDGETLLANVAVYSDEEIVKSTPDNIFTKIKKLFG